MSLNIIPLESYKVIAPVTKLNQKRVYGILRGGNEVTWQQFTTQNFSPSSITWQCNPPSPSTIINRKVWFKCGLAVRIRSVIGALAGNSLIDLSRTDAPRAYPLSQIQTTLSISFVNDNVTTALNKYWNAIMRYYNYNKMRDLDYSTCPAQLDQLQEYPNDNQMRSPFTRYVDNVLETSRGGFQPITLSAPSRFDMTATMTVCEPLWLSPLIFSHEDHPGLLGVQDMTVSMTLDNLQRVWSRTADIDDSPGDLTINVTMSDPTLLFQYVTPNVSTPIPRELSYPYYEFNINSTVSTEDILAGATRSVTLNNIQLKSIPQRIYIFGRHRDVDLNVFTPDTFLVIENISVFFDNRQGLLSSCTEQYLYLMSKKNGLICSWSQWTNYVGSVLCIEFGTDIGLSPIQAPGLLGSYQFQCTVRFKNSGPITVIPQLYAITVDAGTFSIVSGSCLHQVGVFTQSDALLSMQLPEAPYHSSPNIYGGAFLGGKSFFNRLASGVKQALPYVKQALPYLAKSGLPYGKEIAGCASQFVGQGLMGGMNRPRVMRRSQLRRRY